MASQQVNQPKPALDCYRLFSDVKSAAYVEVSLFCRVMVYAE